MVIIKGITFLKDNKEKNKRITKFVVYMTSSSLSNIIIILTSNKFN